jgi:tetratricopeptide (TPR) repeat protein
MQALARRIDAPRSRSGRATAHGLCVWVMCVFCGVALIDCSSEDSFDEIRTLNAEGRYLEAIDRMQPMLEAGDGSPELDYLYGVACVRTGRSSIAIWPLRRAREADGFEVRAGIELARAGLMSGDDRLAIEAATRVIELDPEDGAAYALRAEASLRAGDEEGALRDVALALAANPAAEGDLQLLRLRGLIEEGEIEQAGALFDALEARRAAGELELPGPRYCLARAVFASERGEAELGQELLQACIDEYPLNPLVMAESLAFFDAHGEVERSLQVLRDVLAREPRAAPVRHELAARLRARGDEDAAEQLLVEGTRLEPPAIAAQAWRSLAGHHFELQDHTRAAASWDRFMALTPQPDDEARMAWVETLALSGQFDRALEIAPTLPEPFRPLAMGRIRFEQRRPAEALAYFDAGVRAWPDNPVARYYAGQAAERAGDFDRAISEYRHAIRAGIGGTDAGLHLGLIHLAEGRREPAMMALGHHLGAHPDDVEAMVVVFAVLSERVDGRAARAQLARLSTLPGGRARALAAAARVTAGREGPAAAVTLLEGAGESVDLLAPENAPALYALIEQLAAAERAEEARAWAERALAAVPEAASARAASGLALELTGGSPAAALADDQAALAADPDEVVALLGAARLEAERGETATAIESFAHAARVTSRRDIRSHAVLEMADLLAASGQVDGAIAALEDQLWTDPVDVAAAARLAALLRAADPESPRARELDRRVRRFGGVRATKPGQAADAEEAATAAGAGAPPAEEAATEAAADASG